MPVSLLPMSALKDFGMGNWCSSVVSEERECKVPYLDTGGRDRRQQGILGAHVMYLEAASSEISSTCLKWWGKSGASSRGNSSATAQIEVVAVKKSLNLMSVIVFSIRGDCPFLFVYWLFSRDYQETFANSHM